LTVCTRQTESKAISSIDERRISQPDLGSPGHITLVSIQGETIRCLRISHPDATETSDKSTVQNAPNVRRHIRLSHCKRLQDGSVPGSPCKPMLQKGRIFESVFKVTPPRVTTSPLDDREHRRRTSSSRSRPAASPCCRPPLRSSSRPQAVSVLPSCARSTRCP
jgi:hypothetical protein